jgi:hypothetical protein
MATIGLQQRNGVSKRSVLINYKQGKLSVAVSEWASQRTAAVQSVTVAGESSGTQRKGNIRRWKPLQRSAMETMTEKTRLFVILVCKT